MYLDAICGLDIGSSSVRALILRPLAPFKEKVLAFAESPTRGFSKGVVSNLNLLSDTIEDAVSKAETIAHCNIRRLTANVSGAHIRTFKSRGSVHISDRPTEIKDNDLKRCIESAKVIYMSLDREVLHLVPERFYIDDKMEISEPRGLFGSKLDVDLNIITTLASILGNLAKAINLAGYEVDDMLCSGLGTSKAIFEDKELEEGAIIIDVGKDITEVSLFSEGKLLDCFCFPFGSDDLTQVLQDNLKIMFEDAERLKFQHSLLSKESHVSDLLFSKVEEIMQDAYKKIEAFLKKRKHLPHINIVGGASKMDGFIEGVEKVFNVPVAMGRLRNAGELTDDRYCCSLGLARYALRKRMDRRSRYILEEGGFAAKIISKIRFLLSEYF